MPLLRFARAVVVTVDGDAVHPELRQEVGREITEEDAPETDLASHLLRQMSLHGIDLELVHRPAHGARPRPPPSSVTGRRRMRSHSAGPPTTTPTSHSGPMIQLRKNFSH